MRAPLSSSLSLSSSLYAGIKRDDVRPPSTTLVVVAKLAARIFRAKNRSAFAYEGPRDYDKLPL